MMSSWQVAAGVERESLCLIELAQILGSTGEPPMTATLTAKPAIISVQQRISTNKKSAI
jgi:hypothetical protein